MTERCHTVAWHPQYVAYDRSYSIDQTTVFSSTHIFVISIRFIWSHLTAWWSVMNGHRTKTSTFIFLTQIVTGINPKCHYNCGERTTAGAWNKLFMWWTIVSRNRTQKPTIKIYSRSQTEPTWIWIGDCSVPMKHQNICTSYFMSVINSENSDEHPKRWSCYTLRNHNNADMSRSVMAE
jgi:hypothetical protein